MYKVINFMFMQYYHIALDEQTLLIISIYFVCNQRADAPVKLVKLRAFPQLDLHNPRKMTFIF